MKKIVISVLLGVILFASCRDERPEVVVKKDSVEVMTVKKDTSVTVRKEFKTRSGRKLEVIESKPAISVSNNMITGQGFVNSADTIKYLYKNPMTTALLADLDKNGYEELYIITKASGPGYFLDVLGIASKEDNSFSEIKVENVMSDDMNKDKMFGGYMGNDTIYFTDKGIIREFPVYTSSDYNDLPKGGKRRIIYSLKKEDPLYSLEIIGSENIK